MRVEALAWNQNSGWSEAGGEADLVLYFGGREALANGARYRELKAMHPHSHVVGCSTGGQIHGDDVSDDDIAAVALHFSTTGLRVVCEDVSSQAESHACGVAIGRKLVASDLAGIFVLSDGLNVNGSALVAGITHVIGTRVPLTGGLAADGPRFAETLVSADCDPRSNAVAAIGFYGNAIRFGHGSAGGWDVFGPRRRITRSVGNVLFELDGEPALDLYERYLGEEDAKGLPGTALLFPLRIHDPSRPDDEVVRTVLAVDHAARSMTFAGDVPQQWFAHLMSGNFDRLAQGAADAARHAQTMIGNDGRNEGVAILISCIGRRLLMGQRIMDEVEGACAELSPQLSRIGFYSYGEISPHAPSGACGLHNQTMTVTTIIEAAV